MKFIHLFLVISLIGQMSFTSVGTSSGLCGAITSTEASLEDLNVDGHCEHSCCKKIDANCHKEDSASENEKVGSAENSGVDKNTSSEDEKEGCDCTKKTSSQSLFLSPKQGSFTSRNTIYFKNKFTNYKDYHFDLNHSIFHPPKYLA